MQKMLFVKFVCVLYVKVILIKHKKLKTHCLALAALVYIHNQHYGILPNGLVIIIT